MRILFLSSWFPFPPDNGARMRTWGLLRQLARKHDIAMLSFARDVPIDRSSLEAVDQFCQVLAVVPYGISRQSGPWSLAHLFSMKPRSLLQTYSLEMEARVRDALHKHTFDLIIASEIGPGLCTTPHAVGVSAIPLVIEDLELSMILDAVRAQDTCKGQMRHRLTWWKQRQYAVRLLRQVQGCTVASDQERVLLQRIAPEFEALKVIPNGLDLELYKGDWQPPMSDSLIFPGALTYQANFDAMVFFLETVFPLVQLQCPEVTLRITGRTDGAPLTRLPVNEHVVLTGYVKDVRPVIAQSRVCVVPLLTGGGTRLKILEAMVLGTPVVSTSRGAEGLEATPGEHILIADQPEEFADAVVRLLTDDALHDRLSVNGRCLVKEQYDWVSIGSQLNDFLDEILVRHQSDCHAEGGDRVAAVADRGWVSGVDR